jgi:DNA segregation ATPase FtsK/SpoIIIE-like protein
MAMLLDLFKRDPERELRKTLGAEARYYERIIRRKLTQLGVCYRYKKREKDFLKSEAQEIVFRRAVTNPDAIYLEIDTLRLPRGIALTDINDEDVLQDLSVACRRPVRFRLGVESGAWLMVERKSGVYGIPRRLTFSDVLDNWPHKSRKPLLVPLGVGENRRLVYKSLAQMPHALVGGATGAGKTTLLHAWLCCLIMHNEPWQMQLAIIDLKGGAEAAFYEGIPHLMDNGIVINKDGVNDLLDRIYGIVEGRLAKFRAAKVQNIAAWNYRNRKQYMPRVVLVVDELANVMLDSSIKRHAEPTLADITARGRAPGVHVVLATQRPEVKVVSGLIKANLDGRCAFRCTDDASSRVLLDSVDAARFPDSAPRGRYVYKRGLDRDEIQGPLVTAGQIRDIIRHAKQGDAQESEAARTPPEEIFSVAVKQLGGDFSLRAVYDVLGGKVSMQYLRDLGQEYENDVIEVEGEPYVLQPGRGNIPRKLEPMPDPEKGQHITHNANAKGDNELTDLEIFQIALEYNEGSFSIQKMRDLLPDTVSTWRIGELGRNYEGQTVEIQGERYTLMPPDTKNHIPRRLEPQTAG